ncbi:NAD(P)-dependent oxidoreductase [Hymenobacter sp. DG25A]|uniref:NAD(P)-dependent oxidoreductase n=1 Tax=Hymenobacter sp. DG25A TaxID=1385663 RepID=UPI0006BC5651|nr:NAD(P)-dependent oxidoreductase [Hymenobacter sp. DG25A]ALD21072.1 6-phosphogluconate dehydrogenase [Hymenobacter sp. DG25A]
MAQLALLGLGHMGQAMAANLLQAGHQLTVYNRTTEKTEPLVALGAQLAASPAEAVKQAEVVFTMVTGDTALQSLALGIDGFLPAMVPGSIHASCSTVAPATNQMLARLHEEHGTTLVAAPVFGKPDAVAAANLWVCVSGPAAAKSRLAPLWPAISQGQYDVGEDPGAASTVKLCGNFMLGAAIEAMAEAFTLAEKSGVSRQQIYEIMTGTIFNSPIYKSYGHMVATEDYKPLGAAPHILRKDLDLVMQEAQDHGVPMPIANIVLNHLTTTVARTAGDEDWTSFARRVSEEAGLSRPAVA